MVSDHDLQWLFTKWGIGIGNVFCKTECIHVPIILSIKFLFDWICVTRNKFALVANEHDLVK